MTELKTLKDFEEGQAYSTTKEYWEKYEKITKFAFKFIKTKNQQADFMQLIDDLVLEDDLIYSKELKAEAVKWLKKLDDNYDMYQHEFGEEWIKHFFNITEDDLKETEVKK